MADNLPPEIAAPLSLILTAVFLYLRRREIAAWLGFKEKKCRHSK